MMWPWKRQRIEREQVAQEQERAAQEKHAALEFQAQSDQLAEWSRANSARLRRELSKNGFTELLRQSMGRAT